MEQYESNEDGALMNNTIWNSKSSPVEELQNNNSSSGFECNICLDSVQDPVVTFCGHLYCWPCIYKWINFQAISSDEKPEQQEHKCPVCKKQVSEKTLIPLYGPELTTKSPEIKFKNIGIVIPERPQTSRQTIPGQAAITRTTTNSHLAHQLHHRNFSQENYMASPIFGLSNDGTRTNSTYARIFGNNSETTWYTYPSSYNLAGSRTNRRMRRRMMAVDQSLNRICFFLLCCMILCLLLF